VNPDCTCHDVVLQFVKREGKRGLPGITKKPPPAVYYNYQAKTFEPAQVPEAHQPSLNAMLTGLKDSKRGSNDELKKRHRKLKALFKRALLRYNPLMDMDPPYGDSDSRPIPRTEPQPTRTPKIGRNDPCPCGSGKKYKKCCGS
jgi:hypothetical protein